MTRTDTDTFERLFPYFDRSLKTLAYTAAAGTFLALLFPWLRDSALLIWIPVLVAIVVGTFIERQRKGT